LQVFALGVTEDSEYNPPWVTCLSSPEDRRSFLADRAVVALFVAACHGRHNVCLRLIQSGQYIAASGVFDKNLTL